MKGISFFSNAGIGDIGVEQAGVSIVYANELIERRGLIYKENHPHTYVKTGDINQLNEVDYQEIRDLLDGESPFLMVATPPCQGVSAAGKRDKFDIRNQLIKPAIKVIKEFNPSWVWLENVAGYQHATFPNTIEIVEDSDEYERISIVDFIKQELGPLGYDVEFLLMDAKDYGVPQSRKRMITILTNTGYPISFPAKTHGDSEGLFPYVTTRDSIGSLEVLKAGEKSTFDRYHFSSKHNTNHIKWMEATPEGQTAFSNEDLENRPHIIDKESGLLREIKAFKTTYKRIYWDKPAPTVTMNSGSVSSQNNVHPREARVLTVREIMNLQTLPESYKFLEDSKEKEMRDVIGEAVPCLLGKVITEHIIQIDTKYKETRGV